MNAEHHHGGIGKYILVVLILAVITYLEFAVVEYQIDWLSVAGKLWSLAIMSLIKFFMVIWFFMHLKDDSKTYTGFFTSGMIFALGTFIALSALFTVRSVRNAREVTVSHEGGHEEVVEIPERAFVDTLRVPQPKNQHLTITAPAAPTGGFTLKALPGMAIAEPVSSSTTTEETITETAAETTTEETVTEDVQVAETSTESTTETDTQTTETTTTAVATEWDKALGEKTFSNCMACHQANGQGIPAAFPPLAGHTPQLYNVEGGRQYMINVVLYGLQGEIEIDSAKYNGIMTPWGPLLKDDQIASVINYVLTNWDNEAMLKDFTPITPEEVATERANNFTAQQVYELRGKLPLE